MSIEEMQSQSSVEELLYDVLSQMTPEQLKHQSPNVRGWYTEYQQQQDREWWTLRQAHHDYIIE